LRKSIELNLQLGRFAVKIRAHEEEKLDDQNEEEERIESTYEEDAPYLPKTLLDFLEKDSVRLGLKNEPLRFDDLNKIRMKELKVEDHEEDTNSFLNANPDTNMMFNTIRDNNLNNNRELIEATQIQRRNSDLVGNSLDEIGQHLRDMELSDEDNDDLRAPRQRIMMTTENGYEQNTTSRMPIQTTDLGIHAQNTMVTGASQIVDTNRDQDGNLNTGNRDGSSSRMSMNEISKFVSQI
jgi:hypothetical protein